MPIQDESATPIQEDIPAESAQSNVVMPAKDHMLEEVDDNLSVVSSFQVYRQEEIADCGDADDFSAIPLFMPWTPSVTPPKVTPQVTPSKCIMSTMMSIVDLHFIRTSRVYIINLWPARALQLISGHHDHHHHYPLSQSMEEGTKDNSTRPYPRRRSQISRL